MKLDFPNWWLCAECFFRMKHQAVSNKLFPYLHYWKFLCILILLHDMFLYTGTPLCFVKSRFEFTFIHIFFREHDISDIFVSVAGVVNPFVLAISSVLAVWSVRNACECLESFQMSSCFPWASDLWHAPTQVFGHLHTLLLTVILNFILKKHRGRNNEYCKSDKNFLFSMVLFLII